MPLDGISTRCLASELDAALRDARVDRIFQPDRHDIMFIMRQNHENLRLIVSANPSMPRLHLISETRENPTLPPMFCMLLRKHLQGARVLSVSTPGSERILEIRFQTQNELGDRVEKTLLAELMGRHSNIMLLNEDRRIHDAIVHVDESISRVREVMPARVYVRPPDQGKLSLEAAHAIIDSLMAQVLDQDAAPASVLTLFPPELHVRGLEKAILETFAGYSPALSHEVAFQAGIDGRKPLNQLNESEQKLLIMTLFHQNRAILAGAFRPSVFFIQEGDVVPIDFHALPLSDFAVRRQMPSLSAAMDLYYLERQRQYALAQSRQSLARQVSQQLEQTRKRLHIHEADLKESQQKDTYRRNGDLILSLLHEIGEGQTELNLSAEESPDGLPATVVLDPALTPAQNAQRYYRRYAKARSRAEMSARLLEGDRSELDWLESLENAIAAAESLADVKALRDEIQAVGLRSHSPFVRESSHGGVDASSDGFNGTYAGGSGGGKYGKQARDGSAGSKSQGKGFEPGKPGSRKKAEIMARQKQAESKRGGAGKPGQGGSGKGAGKGGSGKGAKAPAALPPRRYTSSDGFPILVGRNNIQNDQLTLKQARKDDIWLHVQRMPGTHVIISSGGKPVPERTLVEAAETAAYFSRASLAGRSETGMMPVDTTGGAKVAVDYCPVAHVRKPSGARPGKVIYDRYQTVIVQPKDPSRLVQTQAE